MEKKLVKSEFESEMSCKEFLKWSNKYQVDFQKYCIELTFWYIPNGFAVEDIYSDDILLKNIGDIKKDEEKKNEKRLYEKLTLRVKLNL